MPGTIVIQAGEVLANTASHGYLMVPDLELPEERMQGISRQGDKLWYAKLGLPDLIIQYAGEIAGKKWWICDGDDGALEALAHLGSRAKYSYALSHPEIDQVKGLGHRAVRRISDGTLLALVGPARSGHDPVARAKRGLPDAAEDLGVAP